MVCWTSGCARVRVRGLRQYIVRLYRRPATAGRHWIIIHLVGKYIYIYMQ